jgi:hypothetical protein
MRVKLKKRTTRGLIGLMKKMTVYNYYIKKMCVRDIRGHQVTIKKEKDKISHT